MKLPIYDLEALASDLRVENKHPELTEWIQRCADVGSAHQDIDQVIEYLQALSELAGPNPDHELPDDILGTVAGSLMVAAIILYARATDTNPVKGERRKWFGDGKLNPEMRKTHQEVLRSRNKQIAHFGRGLVIDGEIMIEETTVYRPNDPRHLIGFVAARIHNKAAFSSRFAELAITVRSLAEKVASEAFNETRAALIAAKAKDAALAARIKLFPVTNERLLSTDSRPDGEWTDGAVARRYSGNVAARTTNSDPI